MKKEPPALPNKKIAPISHYIDNDFRDIKRVTRKYPMKVTPYYLSLIKEKNDPIWKQCIPCNEELEDHRNLEDPLEEEKSTPVPYLVHKYPDRALLLISNQCAVYCRFCTRKRKVGRQKQVEMAKIFSAIEYIKKHKEIRDVILSGGDPLLRTNKELEQILKKLRAINHIEIIRIGTRIPCVEPSRITKRLVDMLKKYHPLFMNIHFNHPSEITPESTRACALLANAGIPLGSQTVLLKGINDSEKIISLLLKKLIRIRVKPYYLYQCDLVKGTQHFRTTLKMGIDIMKNIQGHISGLCIPQFVLDGPGGKIPMPPSYILKESKKEYHITNYQGKRYRYTK